jgi:LuxR family transcriptional regulator, positive regulator of biofilm formation
MHRFHDAFGLASTSYCLPSRMLEGVPAMQKPSPKGQPPGKIVFVVGPMRLQNDLMASSIEKVTDAHCITMSDLGDLPPFGKDHGTAALVLWDCQGKDGADCLAELESHSAGLEDHLLVGFFNVGSSHGLEQQAVNEGIQGFFYEHDAFDLIAKGVSAMFHGELWIPRRVMADYIVRNSHRRSSPEKQPLSLTSREQEILKLIARGVTNDEIGDMLFISRHTVKTHLYNIFKKIHVPNRLQAALWAAKHL